MRFFYFTVVTFLVIPFSFPLREVFDISYKPVEGSEAACSVLLEDYSGHRAVKINRFIIRFNTYYSEIDSDLELFSSEKCNMQEAFKANTGTFLGAS